MHFVSQLELSLVRQLKIIEIPAVPKRNVWRSPPPPPSLNGTANRDSCSLPLSAVCTIIHSTHIPKLALTLYVSFQICNLRILAISEHYSETAETYSPTLSSSFALYG